MTCTKISYIFNSELQGHIREALARELLQRWLVINLCIAIQVWTPNLAQVCFTNLHAHFQHAHKLFHLDPLFPSVQNSIPTQELREHSRSLVLRV